VDLLAPTICGAVFFKCDAVTLEDRMTSQTSAVSQSMAGGKYRVIAGLGRGGMAEVYLAQMAGPSGFTKLAVLKRLRQGISQDEEMLSMFLDEARLAARLNHPNIVNTFEVGEDTQGHFIAMEYLDGQPLSTIVRRMQKTEPFPLEYQLFVLNEVLTALHYIHELTDYDGTPLNIVHRDISPQNVFVTYAGQVKVMDFGVAKAESASVETRAGVLKGKVTYMAPEQARGINVDRRADLYAVGVMLWEAATKRRLWKGSDDLAVLTHLVSGAPVKTPKSVEPEVPDELERIIMKALAPIAADRYASAVEFQTDLEAFMAETKVAAASRELGRYLSEKFGNDRAEIRTAIESFIKSAPSETSQAAKVPELAVKEASESVSQSVSVARMGPASTSGTAVGWSDAQARARRGTIGAAIAVGLLVVGGLYFATRKDPQKVETASATTAISATPTVAPAPVVQDVELILSASPPSAKFFLDGQELRSNPYVGKFKPDSKEHTLRVEAKGHQSEEHRFTFERSVEKTFALKANAPTAVVQGGYVPPPVKATPAPANGGAAGGQNSAASQPAPQPKAAPTEITEISPAPKSTGPKKPVLDNPF